MMSSTSFVLSKPGGWMDYAAFRAIERLHDNKPWYEWPDELKLRREQAVGIVFQGGHGDKKRNCANFSGSISCECCTRAAVNGPVRGSSFSSSGHSYHGLLSCSRSMARKAA